jgi:ferredoxin
MFKLIIDREKCIGCGSCAAVCNNWEVDDEGKAKALNAVVDEIGSNGEAKDICPVGAIEIEEKK